MNSNTDKLLFNETISYKDALKEIKSELTSENFIHIRIQNRRGKKRVTTIQGIDDKKFDLKLLCKELKKELHTLGNLEEDEKFGKIICIGGSKHQEVLDFLIKENIATKDQIKVHLWE